jgi:hypothetical protein
METSIRVGGRMIDKNRGVVSVLKVLNLKGVVFSHHIGRVPE